jgi:hypothetical protein
MTGTAVSVAETLTIDEPITGTALTALTVYGNGTAGVDAVIAQVTAKVREHKPDISTKAGREAIRRLAADVARSKVALDEMGKDLVEGVKKQVKSVDAERKRIRDTFDELKDEARRPLTEWEGKEQARVDGHEKAIADIMALASFGLQDPAPSEIDARIAQLGGLSSRDWQEFVDRGEHAIGTTKVNLDRILQAAIQRQKDAEELAALRAAEQERARKAEQERIASEAAEKARQEAEAKAAEERRIADEAAAAERARVEAEAKAKIDEANAAAEAQRKAAEEAEARRLADLAAAEQRQKEAAEAAERQRLADAAEAQRRQDEAVAAERQRQADEAKRIADEAAKREKDTKHKKAVNNAAHACLVLTGLNDEQAKAVVVAIAQGKIMHITINY